MPRITLDLNNAEDCRKIKGQWRVGHGLVPGQPNEGLTAQLLNTPARLPDYDDSGWEICANIRKSISKGFTFAWYRITVELPEKVNGVDVAGFRVWFETNVDNYGEVWIDGKIDNAFGMSGRGAVSGFNTPNQVIVTKAAKPGDVIQIAVLGINGPFGDPPGNNIFLRSPTDLRFYKK